MEPIFRNMENDTMLKKLPMMEDIANVAVFLASNLARIQIKSVPVGTTAGFNYKVPRIAKELRKAGSTISLIE